MLRFGVAKPQHVQTMRSKCAEKKIESALKLDWNSVPLLVSPEPYPVSCGKVLIGLPMLLLTKTKNAVSSLKLTDHEANVHSPKFVLCVARQ